MSQLSLVKISSNPELQDFLITQTFVPLFFFSPYTLHTWLNHDGKDLYIATLEEESILIVHKFKNNDIRFLFKHPSKEITNEVKKHFNAKYIAVNDCITPPTNTEFLSDYEYQIELKPIAELTDKIIRKKYNQAVRKNKGLIYRPYVPSDVDAIKTFLGKWNTTRTEEMNMFARTNNDLRFFELNKDNSDVIGGVVLDSDQIVGLTICIKSLDGSLLAVINKVLRGYRELGVYIYVERARHLIEEGFSKAYIGSINNDFKKQFLKNSVQQNVYSYVIHNELELKNEKRYLWMVF